MRKKHVSQNQNTFGASSSSNENNDTNFITQQNFINNPPNNSQNETKTQKNFNSNQKANKNITTVSTKKTIKKSTRIKKSTNPTKTVKASVWAGDTFDNPEYDQEYIEQKKRDKILKMIKNAHVEKLKNYIFLKEINNAHDEMVRLSQEGEMAEAKEMERELNTLHETVIKSNVDAFSRTQLARSHALFGKTSSTFKNNKSTNMNRKNLSKTTRSTNVNVFKSTTKYINENEENEEENEEIEEIEEEKRIKNRKNQNNKKRNKSMNDKKLRNKSNQNPNNYNNYDNNVRNFQNNIPNNGYIDNNSIYQNSNYYPPYNNYNKNEMPNQIQNSNQYNIMGNNPNQNTQTNEYLQPQFNQEYPYYPPGSDKPIRYVTVNYNPEVYEQNQRKSQNIPNNSQKNSPQNNIEDYNNNRDTHNGIIPEKEDITIEAKENEPQTTNPLDQMDTAKLLFSVKTVSSVAMDNNSNKQLPSFNDNEKDNIPGRTNPNQLERLKSNLSPSSGAIPSEKEPKLQTLTTIEIEGKNPQIPPNMNPNDPYQNQNPNSYPIPFKNSFSPEQQQLERPLTEQKPKKSDKRKNSRPKKPRRNQNPQYPNYPPNHQELRYHPKQKPNNNRNSPSYQYPRQRSPESPNYKPTKPVQEQNPYISQPKFALRNPSPNQMRRPQSSHRPVNSQYNPSNPREPYYYDRYEYPRRYRPSSGRSLSRSLSRSPPKEDRKMESNILFAYPSSGRCFACDVKCSISTSGNSPNKYVPYKGSYKILRKHVTDYDAERYGYYQYKSRFTENN